MLWFYIELICKYIIDYNLKENNSKEWPNTIVLAYRLIDYRFFSEQSIMEQSDGIPVMKSLDFGLLKDGDSNLLRPFIDVQCTSMMLLKVVSYY